MVRSPLDCKILEIERLTAKLEMDSEDADAYYFRGRLLLLKGEIEKALLDWDIARKLQPTKYKPKTVWLATQRQKTLDV